jgi:hypothetical protein
MTPPPGAPLRLAWSWQPASHRRSARPGLRRFWSVLIDLVILAVFAGLWLIVFTRGDLPWR